LVTRNARIGFVAVVLGVLAVDAESFREPQIPRRIDGRLIDESVDESDMGAFGLLSERLGCPFPDENARHEIIRGEGRVGCFGRIEGVSSAITNIPAARALWITGTIAFVSLGVIKIPLAPRLFKSSTAET
jgi:hypothetical protein